MTIAALVSYRRRLLVSCLLLLVLINTVRAALGLKQATLREVCLNRQAPIGNLDDVQRLIADLRAKPEACLQNYRNSFYELEELLGNDNHDQTLCGEQKFNQIRTYHLRYIQPPVETLGKLSDDEYKQRHLVPVSLAQFFKAWALQVSGICKRTLVANLATATQLLAATDYELLEGRTLQLSPEALREASSELFVEEQEQEEEKEEKEGQDEREEAAPVSTSSRVGNFFTKRFRSRKSKGQEIVGGAWVTVPGKRAKQFQYDLSFQKLVYMPELEGELQPGDTERLKTPKVLQLRPDSKLYKFMHTCERRFRPIYSRLVLPIVRLSKLGYDYIGQALDDIKPTLSSDPLLVKWMLVTMVCESLGAVELVAAPSRSLPKPLLDYKPIYSYKLEGDLWVKGGEALRQELERTSRERTKGLRKYLYKAGLRGRKTVETIDPLQYVWYRKNHALLGSFIIMASILLGIVSKTINLSG